MAVFRVERNSGYTVMSNHHLRNKELTLKAKGLLSQMLSLPEDWDYALAGLSYINRESIDAIRTAVWELEKAGYLLLRCRKGFDRQRYLYVETKNPEKSRQKAAGCRNTQEVIYTQPLFITPFYLLKGYRSDRLDINIPVIPKAARRDGFTR